MNELIKKLAVQAGLDEKEIRENGSLTLYAFENFDLERFAELLIDECIDHAAAEEHDQIYYLSNHFGFK